MGDNITLTINGKEVIIPDRSEDKWAIMAMNLQKYLHPDASGITFFHWYRASEGNWKTEAIKLYIKSREVGV